MKRRPTQPRFHASDDLFDAPLADRIDLHGMSAAQAEAAVRSFVDTWSRRADYHREGNGLRRRRGAAARNPRAPQNETERIGERLGIRRFARRIQSAGTLTGVGSPRATPWG